jgi:hypothetical protein
MVGSIFASCPTLLAASSRGGGGDTSDVIKYILLWSGGLVVVIVLGMWAAAHLKRRYQQHSDQASSAAGFTLSDLRQLHRSGQMTDEEFARAKAKVVEAARRASERDAKGLSGRATGPAGFPVVEAKPPPGGVGELGDEGDDRDEHDEEPPPGRP